MTLEDNQAIENQEDGFHICGEATLDGNEAIGNLEDGFDINGDERDGGVCEPAADGVVLSNNTARENIAVGIEVSTGSQNISVNNNTAEDNRTDFCNEGTVVSNSGNIFGSTGVCVID